MLRKLALPSISALLLMCAPATVSCEEFPKLPEARPFELPASPLLFPLLRNSPTNPPPVTKERWEAHTREQVKTALLDKIYGHAPADVAPRVTPAAAPILCFSGRAILHQLDLEIPVPQKPAPHKLRLTMYLPASASPDAPATILLGLNFKGNQAICDDPNILIPDWYSPVRPRGSAASRYDLNTVLAAGCGLATIRHHDIDRDAPNRFADGIRAGFSQSPDTPYSWATIAAWAWGLSRAMDALEQIPEIKNVVVWGHSRLGKAALLAGALDTRFAAVISNCSGCAGAALHASVLPNAQNETPAEINRRFPYWFTANYHTLASAFENAPQSVQDTFPDQHLLLALCAPRPLLVNSAEADVWANPNAEYLSAALASPVYRLYGKNGLSPEESPASGKLPLHTLVGDGIYYRIRSGAHDVLPSDWAAYLEFLQREKIIAK